MNKKLGAGQFRYWFEKYFAEYTDGGIDSYLIMACRTQLIEAIKQYKEQK